MSRVEKVTFAAVAWTVATKAAALIILVVCAAAVAGAYGAVHNQISYTVSQEYFTRSSSPLAPG